MLFPLMFFIGAICFVTLCSLFLSLLSRFFMGSGSNSGRTTSGRQFSRMWSDQDRTQQQTAGRQEEKTRTKIFTRDQGEYVDYEEIHN